MTRSGHCVFPHVFRVGRVVSREVRGDCVPVVVQLGERPRRPVGWTFHVGEVDGRVVTVGQSEQHVVAVVTPRDCGDADAPERMRSGELPTQLFLEKLARPRGTDAVTAKVRPSLRELVVAIFDAHRSSLTSSALSRLGLLSSAAFGPLAHTEAAFVEPLTVALDAAEREATDIDRVRGGTPRERLIATETHALDLIGPFAVVDRERDHVTTAEPYDGRSDTQ